MINEHGKSMPEVFNLPENSAGDELKQLKDEKVIERIWQKDHTVWSDSPEEISNRLGWLESHNISREALAEIKSFADQIMDQGYTSALLMGMGGSSMAPEVFSIIFGSVKNNFDLHVIDTTNPDAIFEKEKMLDLEKTLFIVSTKSGGTVETISLMKYFYNRLSELVGDKNAGKNFIAITDPGSGLEKMARKLNFKKIFLNDPDIGGRYSALSYFGLVPAALVGVKLDKVIDKAKELAKKAKTSSNLPEDKNNPAWLGSVLGMLGKSGHDKITFIFPPSIEPYGAWVEQLIAESTGKRGTGLLPVTGEPLLHPENYSDDRVFIFYQINEDKNYEEKANKLIEAGHPLITIKLTDQYDLGAEFFRWMMATAVAGWSLKINPFDQPNVESAKVLARQMVEEYKTRGSLPPASPDLSTAGIEVYCGHKAETISQVWKQFSNNINKRDAENKSRNYIAIQAYLKPDPATDRALQALQGKLQEVYKVAVTVGYGPRFLHSTGQLHKGDSGNGLFVQLTADPITDLQIPDEPGGTSSSISFGILIAAQALGDRHALLDTGRKAIRFQIPSPTDEAIKLLISSI